MHCQICNKNEATIHLTEITEGQRMDMHLCETCAQEQGVAIKSQIPINELLSNLLSVQPEDDEFADPSEATIICPSCGFTIEQFRKEGVLGCPADYEIFESQLQALIGRAHDGKTTHCGKVPSRAPQETKHQMERFDLKRQLDEAVTSEDYELAAELRDKINHMDQR